MIDAINLGDCLCALNLNPTVATVEKLGGTKKKNEKKLKIDEFLPIFSQVKKDKDTGCYEDFLECLKLYDKEENGKMMAAELSHTLLSLGERLEDIEVETVLADCMDKEDDDGYIPYDHSEMGEINYDKCYDDNEHEDSNVIASHIINDILETAMDIAINTNPMMESKKMNIIDEHEEYTENCSELKDIIDGLSKINIGNLMPKPNPEEPPSLDVEMKRLLNEMMSPPFEIVNYENIPRKDGVGDQATEVQQQPQQSQLQPEKESEDPRAEIKVVEKKSRVTDLVMNSKKVLSNLLDEEGRKKLEEWEESNEHVIQVIELQNQKEKPEEINPDYIPLPHDDAEEELLEKVDEEKMVNVELSESVDGKGEGSISGGLEIKSSVMKKKKWHFSFKFFGFKRKGASKQEN